MNHKSFMYLTFAFVFGLGYRLVNAELQAPISVERPAARLSANGLPMPPLPPKVAYSIAELNSTTTHLDLTNDPSNTLSPKIFKYKQLKIITLNNRKLKYLPKEIGQLTNLEELYLNDNQLKQLPLELFELSNLRTLYLKNNQLKKLPAEIGNLTHLRNLDLDGNQLKTLPVSFCKLMLSQRNISQNPFGMLPDCVRYN
jgi:Leucine-rich repeat (LRR) protein